MAGPADVFRLVTRVKHMVWKDIPRDFADLGIELPSFFEGVAVFDSSTLARVDNSELFGRTSFPHAYVTVVRST